MNSARASLRDTMGELSDRVNRAADWREQVRSHPAAGLAVAAVAGLVIGRQIGGLLGVGGVAALSAGAALRAAPVNGGRIIADRIINSIGAALASAVLVPVVSGIQKLVESSRLECAGPDRR